jgi:hypothetical protein
MLRAGPSDPESERIFTFLDKNKDGILVVGEVRIEQLQGSCGVG